MSGIRMAYLLLAHKNPIQINLFVQQLLNYGDCDIFIHVDKKATNIIDKIDIYDNVFVYSKYDIRWGSFEIVKAGVYLMMKVLSTGRYYSHVYFGSAQDLLVKKGLYEFLNINSNKIFLKIKGEVKCDSKNSARFNVEWPNILMIRNDWHIYRLVRKLIQLFYNIGINISPNKKHLIHLLKFSKVPHGLSLQFM